MNAPRKDSVETIVKQWRRERPDLDPWPSGIAARLLRLSTHLRRAGEKTLEPLGLSWESFEMLAALLRAGPPYSLNPTVLYKSMLLTSGAMTARLDRAEEAGLIQRSADPADRRGTIVSLTPEGKKLANRAIEQYFSMVASVLGSLSVKDRAQFTALLSDSLGAFETLAEEAPTEPAKPGRKRIASRT